ncbi:MAG: hypothetical protein ACI30J_07740 [Paludibacteraceae bacterium]
MRHANFDPKKKLLLKRFMNNIRAGDKKRIQNAIIYECHISFTAYRKWIRGLTIPRQKNQIIIDLVAKRFGYGTVYSPRQVSK